MQRTRSRSRFAIALLLMTILVGFMMVPMPTAQADAIGKKIAPIPGWSIHDWAMSPEGTTIVYRAWENLSGGDSDLALFSVSIDGGPSTKLVTLVSGCCPEWKIGPRSSKVLYIDEGGLFSVPIGGGNTTKVSADGVVFQFEITPDGQRAIFTAVPAEGGGRNLYSAVIGSGHPQRVNSPLPEGGDVSSFKLSNVGGGNTIVVYRADQRFDDVVELFSVSVISGNPPVRLNPNLIPGGNVHDFWVAPRGQEEQRVAYLADQDTDEVRELYSVLVGGFGRVKLNGTPAAGVIDPVGFISFNPAGSQVLYITKDAAGVGNLYSVTVAGESRTKLSDDFTRTKFLRAAITPNGQRVVYNADDETTNKQEVFVTWMSGGPLVKISHGSTGAGNMQLSPTGSRVLYATRADFWAPILLWSVPLNGLNPVQINSAVTSLFGYSITPNGQTVVWTTDNSFGIVNKDLYMVPITGGTPVKLSHSLPGADTVGLYEVNPTSTKVVYDAKAWDTTAGEYGPTELFMSTLNVIPVKASGYIDSNGDCGGNIPCYTTIQQAIDAVETGSTILIAAGTYTGGMTLNESKDLTIQGGWDSSFENQTGTTILRQAPKALQGSLTLQELTVKPEEGE